MSTTIDLSALDRLQDGLRRIVNPDATDLMLNWMRVIDEDNRRGILAAQDRDGFPLAPVTYRPLKYSPSKSLKPTAAQRSGAKANARKGAFLGVAATAYGNLTSAEYRRLGGPPLAPRGPFSRVIANLKTGWAREGTNWVAFGYWDQVLDRNGRPFLHYHFVGSGRLPRRDLRGLRPEGVRRATEALRNWARLLVRQAFGEA